MSGDYVLPSCRTTGDGAHQAWVGISQTLNHKEPFLFVSQVAQVLLQGWRVDQHTTQLKYLCFKPKVIYSYVLLFFSYSAPDYARRCYKWLVLNYVGLLYRYLMPAFDMVIKRVTI